jgi:hypothetical protein
MNKQFVKANETKQIALKLTPKEAKNKKVNPER